MIDNGVLRKIQKLRENSGSTEAEKQAAAAKLQVLLTKLRLTEADIRPLDNEGKPKANFTRKLVPLGGRKNAWQQLLLEGIADINHGSIIGRHGHKANVWVILEKEMLDPVLALWESLKAEVEELAIAYKKTNPSMGYHPRLHMASYREGVAAGILDVMRKAAKEEEAAYEGTSALVLHLDHAREEYVTEAFPRLVSTFSSRGFDFGAYSRGQAAGHSVNPSVRKLR